MSSETRKHARHISFNQTGSNICLVNDDSQGFKIINTDTLKTLYNEATGSYSQIQLYFDSSLVIFVGLGEDIKFSPRELKLYNIETSKMICHLLYSDTISNVQVNKDRIVVSLTNEIYIYNLTNMKLLHVIRNLRKLNGLISLSMGTPYTNLLIYPTYSTRRKRRNSGRKISNDSTNGSIGTLTTNNSYDNDIEEQEEQEEQDEDEVMKEGDIIIFDMMLLRPLMVIEAHENRIQCIEINEDGSLIATASKLGTIIRIFNTINGTKIKEFRRGSYKSIIQSMKFSSDNNFLVVTSSSNTIHIFELQSYDINKLQESEINNSNISVKETTEQDLIVLDTISANNTTNIDNNNKNNSKTSMRRMIKKSSQKITREANKRFNQLFIGGNEDSQNKINIQRHFAWCKFPIDKIKERGSSSIINIDSEPILLNGLQLIQLQTTSSNEIPIKKTMDNNDDNNNLTLLYLRIKILTSDGNLYTYLLDPVNGGECILQSQLYIL
ncbi:similar to Saccharomyces cerevisiae YFR021W ATG18 Phosphoinositide binding protein required for vesicle formation in autophagy and the cytoplasm-to-vacuole targeting (Cvt) pathway [Maudiozyma saulgeensis]|uniref:Similar to Saccharomyces cerevisiae YFR021W ATG18 Phosphoinositide binding protein required for vesicle formation in autophagy and the cytoplasm-to-vacuole targeting (Cvt) pathway n=1 Tax=Maudiozyma saulgeensis TaxID=1789683 RepID=A0A1X7R0N1_9SACH|nr:similar to Saccharomyces cerevisiae YFR021W ATG18 Phosphoinositide binding protein required for vesicle formation in autophagy and the cytoplasm-to-vacuole targeting (Cvt) pathway [Kazachstania saulgeensis]